MIFMHQLRKIIIQKLNKNLFEVPGELMLLAQDDLALEGEAGKSALLEHHDVLGLQTEVVVCTNIQFH